MHLSVYKIKNQGAPLFDTCPFIFFIEKLYLHDTTTLTGHSLPTYKMLPCFMINLRKPKIHHFSEKRFHTGSIAKVPMRFIQKQNNLEPRVFCSFRCIKKSLYLAKNKPECKITGTNFKSTLIFFISFMSRDQITV